MNIQTNLFRLNRYLNRLAQGSELSIARFDLLRLIKQHNPITLRQLCEIQQVSMPTMSRLVDELQNEALVIRAQSKEDARKRWIVPTQKGIQVLGELMEQDTAFWQQKLSHLSESQKQQLQDSLKLLADALG